ncbi:hypothetical protein [Nostoc sphaeroides]|uniref:Uncharacterized protein n=1 Tax=Nostoc sphaeroides CCNUC1 TaxID=2653204 RepID=A0A5P8WF82_9NOSO|nr:hypothetical protein [Nostoc sphaeroides]QFS51324.1 hypothetical protein GXM_08818 [Nostoc sphaeroides CCNUC1]
MEDDTQQLIAIQEELEQISDRLRKIFPSTHPQFDDVFEDIGAAGYYKRASWLLFIICDKNRARWWRNGN